MEVLEKTIETASPREKVFEALYERAFPLFARFAGKLQAPFSDAQDIFHDALLIYYQKITQDDLVPATSPEAYVLGIAKHLWIKKFKGDKNKISLDSVEAAYQLPADHVPSVNDLRVLRFLEASGKKCLELLRNFYYEKKSLRQLAVTLGYSNERSVAVGKFKCLAKMRAAIKSKSIRYEDFVD